MLGYEPPWAEMQETWAPALIAVRHLPPPLLWSHSLLCRMRGLHWPTPRALRGALA